MQHYYDNIGRVTGASLQGVTVLVTQNGVPATLYSDNGITQKANPLSTDVNGAFDFYAANGSYTWTARIIGGNQVTEVATLFDAADLSASTGATLVGYGTGTVKTALDAAATSAALAASTGAGLVGFQQAGTGSVARTLQDKARELPSVADYGTNYSTALSAFYAANPNIALNGSLIPSVTTATTNFSLGPETLHSLVAGKFNFAIGRGALASNVGTGVAIPGVTPDGQGSGNMALGRMALNANTTGYENTAIGDLCQVNNISGRWNVGVGWRALWSGTANECNVAVGSGGVLGLCASSNNIGMGWATMENLSSGGDNTAIGHIAMNQTTTGGGNVAVGSQALTNNVNGQLNVVVGYHGMLNALGSNNVAIGGLAGLNMVNNTNVICIGYNAQPSSNASTDEVILGDTTITAVKSSGNYTPTTSGRGVDFGVHSAAAGSTNKVFSDYEEGTWTPAVTSFAGTFTSVAATGVYTKKGREVTAILRVTITTNGTASGAIYATLPFTNSAVSSVGSGRNEVTGVMLFAALAASDNKVTIAKYDNTYSGADGNVLDVTITYFV